MNGSRPASHFERLYQRDPDPWSFATSAYEQAKYRQTMAALGHRRFTVGLEVGCSIGVLTRMLAPRCDTLLGVDIVESPLHAARSRCAGFPHVRFQRMQVPAEWPAERFDLIVFSEVLYFLTPSDIERCAALTVTSLLPAGIAVLVNWLGKTDDPTTGKDAADHFLAATARNLAPVHCARHDGYRLDVLSSKAVPQCAGGT
jgi:cyclopropane fatty-acyl-phospholipid synthase-like methyltransferase